MYIYIYIFFFFFNGTGVLTQGLVLARQALYHLNYAPTPLCFRYVLNRVLLLGMASLDLSPPIYASCIARMTGMCHLTQCLLVEMGSHKFFAQGGLKPQFSQSSPPK
jgi:hypothetical protein